MEKNEEFNDLMKINSLNKEVPKENEDSKSSSSIGDTVTEGDVSEDENEKVPTNLDDNLENENILNIQETIKQRVAEMEKDTEKIKEIKMKKTKSKKVKAEDSSEVEGSDHSDDDEKEEELPEVKFPSLLTYPEKL